MEEKRQLTQAEIDAQYAFYNQSIEFGKLVSRLMEKEDFKTFLKHYIDNFALGQLSNAHNYNKDGSEKFLVNYKARASLKAFIDSAISDGINDEANLEEFKLLLAKEGYGEQE